MKIRATFLRNGVTIERYEFDFNNPQLRKEFSKMANDWLKLGVGYSVVTEHV